MALSYWERFSSRLKTPDAAREPFRRVLQRELRAEEPARLLIYTPSNETVKIKPPASVLALTDHGCRYVGRSILPFPCVGTGTPRFASTGWTESAPFSPPRRRCRSIPLRPLRSGRTGGAPDLHFTAHRQRGPTFRRAFSRSNANQTARAANTTATASLRRGLT